MGRKRIINFYEELPYQESAVNGLHPHLIEGKHCDKGKRSDTGIKDYVFFDTMKIEIRIKNTCCYGQSNDGRS